jgi:hypothetical protein
MAKKKATGNTENKKVEATAQNTKKEDGKKENKKNTHLILVSGMRISIVTGR